jgi:hypothetical protein
MKKILSAVNRILIHLLLGWPQLPIPQPTKNIMRATRNPLLLGIILTATASAQLPEEGQGHKPPPPPRPPLVAALDLDGDGRLSAEEIKKAPESLNSLDANGNGRLSDKELAPPSRKDRERPKNPPPGEGPQGPPPAEADGPPRADGEAPHGPPPAGPRPKNGEAPKDDTAQRPKPPRPHGPHGPSPLLRILDKNADGSLTKKEIDDSSESLLACDADGDGALTIDELRPKDAPGFGPGGPPPHGPGPGGPPPHGPGRR